MERIIYLALLFIRAKTSQLSASQDSYYHYIE